MNETTLYQIVDADSQPETCITLPFCGFVFNQKEQLNSWGQLSYTEMEGHMLAVANAVKSLLGNAGSHREDTVEKMVSNLLTVYPWGPDFLKAYVDIKLKDLEAYVGEDYCGGLGWGLRISRLATPIKITTEWIQRERCEDFVSQDELELRGVPVNVPTETLVEAHKWLRQDSSWYDAFANGFNANLYEECREFELPKSSSVPALDLFLEYATRNDFMVAAVVLNFFDHGKRKADSFIYGGEIQHPKFRSALKAEILNYAGSSWLSQLRQYQDLLTQ